jgi:hypothetical protein
MPDWFSIAVGFFLFGLGVGIPLGAFLNKLDEDDRR